MRIISPVDHLAEAAQLLAAGADELYGGIASSAWSGRFGRLVSINQRTYNSAQISSFTDFQAIVKLTRDQGKAFSLTLNAPFYTDQQIELITELVTEAVAAGINNVILADLGLLRSLREKFPALGLHVSTMAHLTNSSAVREYVALGCQRLVLERHLSVSEIASIIKQVPGVVFDVFMLVGRCPNTEGLCSFHHSSPDKIWPCEIPYDITPVKGSGSERLAEAIERQSSWSRSNRRHACGLCAVPHLQKLGVEGLKLVGRGAPAAQKIANILLVKEIIDLSAGQPDEAEFASRTRQAYLKRFGHPCSPNTCYYPEFYVGE